ncbi:Glycylpeptide N-tetradecanoyltransferase [Penicillium cataractarum]|uniref:Glycylpeptide N-tetradecanoyltransferase n=1 Tax=Penicillium cataractarum TaxID=2100454 RepID=A0A9W9VUF0_9EURO|nr:Glycylpeptide N-tetradecanoyltransferase [Penicillium cataractarum]KAJ5389562.1 Glycylpeptide N-tetradecanoyltransferase [Penicillium cataractarum]
MSDSKDKGKAPKPHDDKPEESGADAGSEASKGTQSPPYGHTRTFAEFMNDDIATSSSGTTKKIPAKLLEAVIESNPSLKNELAGMDQDEAAKTLANIDISQLLTGLSMGNGKNQKDMASYKFWQTQPVPRFDDQANPTPVTQGPIKMIDPEKVSKTPDPLLEGFEWCTLDLTNEEELRELYELLNNHYVEDDNAMFRFAYSQSFLHWALMSPGWKKEWHVGVRATKSRKLVASICGVPTEIRVRGERIKVTEINFLCIHKKLRSKRLAPVLIKEITRRCYVNGIFQAIYTGGVILPTPVSSCRYYHRALDWLKLYEVGFSPLPHGSTKARQITKNHLPSTTSTPGLRPMESKDIDAVLDLLERYLLRFDMNQAFTREEIDHWLVYKPQPGKEQVVWAYVVEDPETKKITDFVSFYNLESTVINNDKHELVRAAYLYYYASETAFNDNAKALKARLQVLMNDALICARQAKFDVFNALTSHDNPMFLEHLKFGAGDGQLHFYLYNYRTAAIPGGINDKNLPDEKKMGGVGIVML